MKICFISEYFYPDTGGSTGTILTNLTRYLKDHYPDLEIDVVTSKNMYRQELFAHDRSALASEEVWDGIRIYRVDTPRTKVKSTAKRLLAGAWFAQAILLRLLQLRRYDRLVVVTNPPMLVMAARGLAALRGTPYLYLIHDLFPDLGIALGQLSPRSRIVRYCRALQRGWLLRAETVIVLGRCMKEYLARQYGVEEDRVAVIPNWADTELISGRKGLTVFRKRHGLEGLIALYSGNLGQFQNFDDLLDASRILAEQEVPLTLVFVGGGAKRDHIARRIETESLRNVKLFPLVPREELGDLMASADLALITLEPGIEGIGVPSKLYNIMASGTPAVALVHAFSEVARVIEEESCGVRVTQGDPEALAQALQRLVDSPGLRMKMGENGRRAALEKYTLAHVAEQFYHLLTGRASSPSPREADGPISAAPPQRPPQTPLRDGGEAPARDPRPDRAGSADGREHRAGA